MPTRKFEITWPDEHGKQWMNQDNLLTCLTAYCRGTEFTVLDVTGDQAPCPPTPSTGMKAKAPTDADYDEIVEIDAAGNCYKPGQTSEATCRGEVEQ
jgi:hypothetical protein